MIERGGKQDWFAVIQREKDMCLLASNYQGGICLYTGAFTKNTLIMSLQAAEAVLRKLWECSDYPANDV